MVSSRKSLIFLAANQGGPKWGSTGEVTGGEIALKHTPCYHAPMIPIRNQTLRFVLVAAVQLLAISGLYLFLRWFIPQLPGWGMIGFVLTWFPAIFGLALWMDGNVWLWRYVVAFVVLFVGAFLLLLAALELGGNWGLLALPTWLWFGYRLANVIDNGLPCQPQ
jgi:hypothetical protein